MRTRVSALSVGVFLLAACSGGSDEEKPGCLYADTGLCAENFVAPQGARMDWDLTKKSCLENGGTWQSCPAGNRVGSCTGSSVSGGGFDYVLYAGLVCTAAQGEEYCRKDITGFWSTYFTPGTAGCGPATPGTFSCDLPDEHLCSTSDGSMSAERTRTLQAQCAFAMGTVVGDCATANRSATCAYVDVTGESVVATLYAGADLARGESDCARAGGTWTLD